MAKGFVRSVRAAQGAHHPLDRAGEGGPDGFSGGTSTHPLAPPCCTASAPRLPVHGLAYTVQADPHATALPDPGPANQASRSSSRPASSGSFTPAPGA